MARTRLYRNGVLVSEDFNPADISDHLDEPGVAMWLDMCEPDEADLATITEELGLHRLAVEDAVHEHQRPKLDHYESHLFLAAYVAFVHPYSERLNTSEISVFITPTCLVTVRKEPSFDIDQVVARWDNNADLAKSGVGFLLHGLLDYVVDTHIDAVQQLDEKIEQIEEALFAEHVDLKPLQRRSYRLRRALMGLRKVAGPMREVLEGVQRHGSHLVDNTMRPYYADVQDHVLKSSGRIEALRDLAATLRETELTVQSNQLNVIMKQVTSWAAVIAVPTLITGFYGQNVNYPGINTEWGFWVSTLVIAVASVGLWWSFRKRGWL
ncbi:magnesium transporter CorA family protein [Kutzneria sp. NPDC052558]|uniref:magnesium transporter CorA family protein n=1 Tax=Kutzneria sp. NPDC052558 TaxID=3364121 RepID=UPI0037CC4D5B